MLHRVRLSVHKHNRHHHHSSTPASCSSNQSRSYTVTYPDVVVLPLTSQHRDVLQDLSNQLFSVEELLVHSLNYWRWGIYFQDLDEEWVWTIIREAVMALPNDTHRNLSYKYRESVERALYMECDHLTALIIDTAETLSSVLGYLGDRAEAIQHICRAGIESEMLMIAFYSFPRGDHPS